VKAIRAPGEWTSVNVAEVDGGTSTHRSFSQRDAALWWRRVAVAALFVGVILRVWQYLARTSLWVDEAALARNVLDRDLWQLVSTPLAFAQVAPRGWLALVKLCSALFGNGELSLRLVPLAGGIGALVAAHALARRLLTAAGVAVATLLVALAVPLILFSSNLKPYSTDVCLVLCSILIADRAMTRSMSLTAAAALSVFGFVAVLLSNAAVFALVPAAGVLAYSTWHMPQDRRRRLAVVAAWSLAVVLAAVLGIHSMTRPDAAYMQVYWAGAFGPTRIQDIPRWGWEALNALFGTRGGALQGNLQYAITTPFLVIALVGALRVMWTSVARGILLIAPIVMAAGAALLRVYPFQGRLMMFLMPLLLLLATAGTETAGSFLKGRWVSMLPFTLVPFAAQAALHYQLPQYVEHLRPALEHVAENARPNDAIWVYYGAGEAFRYYQHRISIDADVSVCDRSNPRGQLQQIDRLRGRSRVWILMTHTAAKGDADERGPLVGYLDQIGIRRSVFSVASSDGNADATVSAFLYDLSDQRRLATTTAALFPIPARAGTEWSCYGTMTPDAEGFDKAAAAVLNAAGDLRP
jgi:hypothetical protein